MLLVLLVSAPFLYFFPTLRSSPIRAVVVLHAVILSHHLLRHPPPNIFTQLHLPLSTPSDAIRAILLQHSPSPNLPAHLEQLLGRLNSFETRTLYVRFGHAAVTTCEFCHSYADFAFYALPTAAMAYIRQTATMGLVTIRGTGHEHLRTAAIGTVIVLAGAEAYLRSTATIHTESVFMWSDMLEILRTILFACLPIIVDFLPRRIPVAPPHPAEQTMQTIITRLHALKYYRGAIMRNPTLNAAASSWWAQERRDGETIRTDERVQSVARGVGIPFEGDEPRLRNNARGIARDFVAAGVPPPGVPIG